MGIPTVERAVIQEEKGKYTLLVEGTGLQVCIVVVSSMNLCVRRNCWQGSGVGGGGRGSARGLQISRATTHCWCASWA